LTKGELILSLPYNGNDTKTMEMIPSLKTIHIRYVSVPPSEYNISIPCKKM
jgi:hypothetical protein